MNFNLLSIMDGSRTLSTGFSLGEMGQVVVLGVGIVFFGLVCIVLLCSIMSAIMKAFDKPKAEDKPAAVPATVSDNQPIANKQELIAAISAVIAEDLGTDIKAIRIKSIKRI